MNWVKESFDLSLSSIESNGLAESSESFEMINNSEAQEANNGNQKQNHLLSSPFNQLTTIQRSPNLVYLISYSGNDCPFNHIKVINVSKRGWVKAPGRRINSPSK